MTQNINREVRLQQVLDFICQYVEEYKVSPTPKHMINSLDMGRASVYYYLAKLKELKYIDYDERGKEPIRLLRKMTDWSISLQDVRIRLMQARERRGYSQVQVTTLLGYSNHATISNLETGRSYIRIDTMLRLCELYKVNPTWILTGKIA